MQDRCESQADLAPSQMVNHVAGIYDGFTLEQLSAKIAQLVRPPSLRWSGDVQVIYQSVAGLRSAIPAHRGDWYFTGDYPTPGGYKVLNTSFLNWRAACDARAY